MTSVAQVTKGENSGTSSITKITSDDMTVRNQDQLAIFTGNVMLTQGNLIVRSDKMLIYYKDNGQGVNSPKNEQEAEPKSGNHRVAVEKMEAIGQVKITKDKGRATCGKAIYYKDEEKIVLTVNPVAWQKGNRVKGKRIIMFLEEDRTEVEGKAQVIFESEEQQ